MFCLFRMNLLSKLFFTFPEVQHKEQIKFFKQPKIKTDFNAPKEFLFESFISIDAIAFYTGAYHINDSELSTISKKVLQAKALIIKNPKVLPYFFKFEENATESLQNDAKTVKELLKYRNKLIEKDTSNILKNLILKKQLNLAKRFAQVNLTQETVEEIMDKQYKEMMQRIKSHIVNGGNLVNKLKVEKENFYNKYVDIDEDQRINLILNLSLGGFIVRLPAMYTNIKKLQINKKNEAIRKWVTEFMKVVEDLGLKTKNKSLVEQKIILSEFLKNCLYRKDHKFDKMFEMRSEILDLSLDSFKDYMQENVQQEEEIKKMIFTVENIRDGSLNIKFNRDITEKYINYLNTGSEADKKSLLQEFEQ